MTARAEASREAKRRWGRRGRTWVTTEHWSTPPGPMGLKHVGRGQCVYGSGKTWAEAFAAADKLESQ